MIHSSYRLSYECMMEDSYASKPTNSDKKNYRNFHKYFKGQRRTGMLHENKKELWAK